MASGFFVNLVTVSILLVCTILLSSRQITSFYWLSKGHSGPILAKTLITAEHKPNFYLLIQDEKKLEEELASFRREWKEEIRRTVTDSGSSQNSPSVESPSPSSREGSPSPLLLENKNSSNTTSLTKEEKVLFWFFLLWFFLMRILWPNAYLFTRLFSQDRKILFFIYHHHHHHHHHHHDYYYLFIFIVCPK